MSDLRHWIISVPAKPSRESAFSTIQQCTAGLADCARFNVPGNLRVGTLDSLMAMSDELVKVDHMVEHTAKKIGTQIFSLSENKHEPGTIFLSIGGKKLDLYLRDFTWDTAKYSVRLSVQELTARFQEQVSTIEEEYRQKITDYSNVAHGVAQYERSLKANLTVRDLSNLVNVDDILDTEFITTLFIVCNKQQEKAFEAVYESFTTDPDGGGKFDTSDRGRPSVVAYVVPGSCKRISEEGDQCLLRVHLLRAFKDLFKQEAAKHHVTVREVKIDTENKSGEEKYNDLKKELSGKKNRLFQWCQTNFTEVFTAWAHLKALRIHVESILRFGLPADYVGAVIKPHKISHEKKLRGALEVPFAQHGSVHMQDMKDDIPGFSSNEKFYPYVYLEMDLNYCKE